MDPIDLLKRLQSAPIGPLLEYLREIHRVRTQEPDWIPAAQPELWRALVSGGAGTPADVGVPPELSLPALPPPDGQAPEPDDIDPGSSSYDAVRELFGQRESALSRQSRLVDRVLDQLRSGRDVSSVSASSPLQQEVRLACPVRGHTAGRFIVASEAAADLALRLQTPEHPAANSEDAGPKVSFDPPELALGAGEERLVKVGVDLSASSAVAGDRFELPVEAVDAAGNVLVKVWVDLMVIAVPAEEVR